MPFNTTKNHLTSLLIASFAFALLSVFIHSRGHYAGLCRRHHDVAVQRLSGQDVGRVDLLQLSDDRYRLVGLCPHSVLLAHDVARHDFSAAVLLLAHMDGITHRSFHALLDLVLLAWMERRLHTNYQSFCSVRRFLNTLRPVPAQQSPPHHSGLRRFDVHHRARRCLHGVCS